ncbi:MAG: hypothetical protein HFI28_14115 [Lachnospiraceae bacterium]|nr:hypothetical protein [Lachnospiraceae bacterium]
MAEKNITEGLAGEKRLVFFCLQTHILVTVQIKERLHRYLAKIIRKKKAPSSLA